MKRTRLTDFSLLDNFHCGIREMDDFIHTRLEKSIKSHFCVPYVLHEGKTIVAFYALSYDAVVFSEDYLDDLLNGYSSSGNIDLDISHLEIFKNKEHYPAMDIAYFAVNKDFQRQYIGSALLEDVIQQIKDTAIAGCQFVVVDALVTKDYSALGFYSKNRFTVCEDRKPYKDCVRMYRVLYPKK